MPQNIFPTSNTYPGSSPSNIGGLSCPADGVDNVQASTVNVPYKSLTEGLAHAESLLIGPGYAPPAGQPFAVATSGLGRGSGASRLQIVTTLADLKALAGAEYDQAVWTGRGLYSLFADGGATADDVYIVRQDLAAIPAWAASTQYTLGRFVQNDSGKTYLCTAAGTSAASGGPTGTGGAIADGSCTWAYQAVRPRWTHGLLTLRGAVGVTTGTFNGIAALDSAGLVPYQQLPGIPMVTAGSYSAVPAAPSTPWSGLTQVGATVTSGGAYGWQTMGSFTGPNIPVTAAGQRICLRGSAIIELAGTGGDGYAEIVLDRPTAADLELTSTIQVFQNNGALQEWSFFAEIAGGDTPDIGNYVPTFRFSATGTDTMKMYQPLFIEWQVYWA